MTLEIALQDCAAAVRALTDMFARSQTLLTQAAAMPPAPPALLPADSVKSSSPPPAGGITYDALKQLALQAASVNLDASHAMMARFGLSKLRDAAEDQWPAIAEMAKRILEEGYDPAASDAHGKATVETMR